MAAVLRHKRPKMKRTVAGKVTFARPVFGTIAVRALSDVRDVKQPLGDAMSGFLGKLLAWGPAHPGIQVDDAGEEVAFNVEVVARHGADFYELGLAIQRRIGERVRHMTGRRCVVNVSIRGTAL